MPTNTRLQCFKIPYSNRGEARKALIVLKRNDSRPNLQIYRCPFCPNFHLGHGKTSFKGSIV